MRPCYVWMVRLVSQLAFLHAFEKPTPETKRWNKEVKWLSIHILVGYTLCTAINRSMFCNAKIISSCTTCTTWKFRSWNWKFTTRNQIHLCISENIRFIICHICPKLMCMVYCIFASHNSHNMRLPMSHWFHRGPSHCTWGFTGSLIGRGHEPCSPSH